MKRRQFIKGILSATILISTNPINFCKAVRKVGINSPYKELKRKILEAHAVEMERAFLYGDYKR